MSDDQIVGNGPCYLCGRDPAVGYASISIDGEERWYCHEDAEDTCYEKGVRSIVHDKEKRPCRDCGETKRMHGVARFYTLDDPPPLCLGYRPKPLIEGVL